MLRGKLFSAKNGGNVRRLILQLLNSCNS